MIFKKKHTSITMVIIGLIITVFFTSAGLIYIKSVSNVMTSDAHSNVVKLAARGSGTFSLYFTRIIDQLRTFSRIITDNEVEDIEEFGSISKNLSYANDFKSICIFDKNGNGYNFLSNLEVKAQNKPFFEEVKNGHDFISSPFIDQNGNDVITVSSPIIKDGVFYGAVVAFIPTSYLSEVLLTTYTPSETTASFIIDSDANIVFSSIKRDKRTNIEEVVNDINTHVHINKKLTEMHFLTALTTGKMASGEYKDEKNDMLFSFMPLKLDKEWSYIIVTPSKNVVETGTAVMDLSWKFVAVALMFLFVVFIIIIKFKNKTTKALTDLALYDQITGIPNWTKFKIDCEEYFKKSPNGKVAMVSFDIDEFKVINDLYGHKAGDETLAFVGKQLQKSLLLDEKCGRYSSNTFLVLMRYEDDADIISRIKTFQSLIKPQISGYIMTFSFGIYKVGDKKDILIDLMFDRANLARNTIKGNHEEFYSFYNDDVRTEFLEAKSIENEMEKALENNEFEVYYQPKTNVKTGNIVGAEALIRWNHPTKGLIPPNKFVPQFEKNGFIVHIDNFVLEQACKTIRLWKNNGVSPIPISVNFSPIHLRNENFVEYLFETTKKEGIEPSLIEIELTETSIFDNIDVLTNMATKMKKYGFLLSLDDFGSGYSSLNVLNKLPVDILKIDRLFFNRTANTARGKELVTCIVKMAQRLGITPVSEGVETVDQVEFLQDVGCDIAQGFYYSKPLPYSDFQDYFKEHNKL